MSKASLENEIRNDVLKVVVQALIEAYDTDVKPISSSEVMMPCLDSEGNEKYAVIKVSIPRGTRSNGGYIPYNGYEAAEEWEAVVADNNDKAAKRAEKKAREEAEKERKRRARKTIKTMKSEVQEILPDAAEKARKEKD